MRKSTKYILAEIAVVFILLWVVAYTSGTGAVKEREIAEAVEVMEPDAMKLEIGGLKEGKQINRILIMIDNDEIHDPIEVSVNVEMDEQSESTGINIINFNDAMARVDDEGVLFISANAIADAFCRMNLTVHEAPGNITVSTGIKGILELNSISGSSIEIDTDADCVLNKCVFEDVTIGNDVKYTSQPNVTNSLRIYDSSIIQLTIANGITLDEGSSPLRVVMQGNGDERTSKFENVTSVEKTVSGKDILIEK